MKICGIVIKSIDNVIAVDGRLPWDHKEDMARFKRLTSGAAVVMGRATWDSLYVQPLPNRDNIVISRTLQSAEGATLVRSAEHAIEVAFTRQHDVLWVIGGAALYRTYTDLIDEWHITEVHDILGNGLKIPSLDKDIWICSDYQLATSFRGTYKTFTRRES